MLGTAYLTANGTDVRFPTFTGGRPSHTMLGALGELGFINIAPAVEFTRSAYKGGELYAQALAQQAGTKKATSPWAGAVEAIGGGLQSIAELTTRGITTLGPAYFQLKQAEQAVKALRSGQKTAAIEGQTNALIQQIRAETALEAAQQAAELERRQREAEIAAKLAALQTKGGGEKKTDLPPWLIPAGIAVAGVALVGMFALRK